MFDQLKLQFDNLINFQINENEFYQYINNLITSKIINDEYIINLIKSNIFISSKYNSQFYNLLLYLNDKQLLKRDHYNQLIKHNYYICKDIINLKNYEVIDFISDIYNNYDTITESNIFNYLNTIIKLLKKDIDHHHFLLLLNNYPDYINRYIIIRDYIYYKEIHKSYKEWCNKYPNLWSQIIDITKDLNIVNFNNILSFINYFDIDKKELFNHLINKLNIIVETINDYNITPIFNFLIEYSFNKKELITIYKSLFLMLLSESRFENSIYYIIHNKYYLDEYKQNIIDYLKNIIQINYTNSNNIHNNYYIKCYDFIFDNILDINIMINNGHLDKTIKNYYHLQLNDRFVSMLIFSNILLYLISYIFNNNIDYDFNKYDKNIICDIMNNYIDHNKDKSSDKLNKMINEYINNINTFNNDCNNISLKKSIDNNYKYNNYKLIFNIIVNNIQIDNIDYLLDYINNNTNSINYYNKNDKIYNIKILRFLDRYHKKITNKYTNLENKLKNYKLNISYISKILNHKICDDLCKKIFDYL